MKSGIYKIENTKNGKIYVGQTKNFTNRKRSHFNSLREGSHYNKYLQRSFNKYGEEKFKFEVIERCSCSELCKRERYWIEKLETEYSEKGYNAAYAVEVFSRYDKERKINKSKRSLPKILNNAEVKAKSKIGVQKYWREATDDIRQKHSLSKATLDIFEIKIIKEKLAFDIDKTVSDIADELNLDIWIVVHAARLKSYKFFYKELNNLIIFRNDRKIFKEKRILLRMWTEGKTTKEISEYLNVNERTAIRRIKKLSNNDYDRCRLNVINRTRERRFRQVKTLKGTGKTKKQVHDILGYSRGFIRESWDMEEIKLFSKLNESRGLDKVFNVETYIKSLFLCIE